MNRLRAAGLAAAAAVLALCWVELGLRGAALAWRLAYRAWDHGPAFPVYVVGESTAYGEPSAPKINFSRALSMMFAGRLRGRPIELINLALQGSDTEQQYWRLFRELALRPRRPGIVLVYAGINETALAPEPSALRRLASRSWLFSRACAWLRTRRREGPGLAYEYGLGRLLDLARGWGYPVVVSTLVGNLRDFQPDSSRDLRDDPGLARLYERALGLEARGRWKEAAGLYARLAAGRGEDPGLMHREGRCLLALGRLDEGRRLLQAAADMGGNRRPTSAQDLAVRRQAARSGAVLADCRAAFAAASPQGVPGADLFWDAHHPNLRGDLILAGCFAREVSRVVGDPVARPDLSETELVRETGFTERDREDIYASRLRWYCGETFQRVDRREPLRMARLYLDLAERGRGRPLPAYRFLLALVARDRVAVQRALAERDALRRDQAGLEAIGCNPDWVRSLVADAALPEELAGQAQGVVRQAQSLAVCRGERPARTSAEQSRYLESKSHADQGVNLILSGREEDGRRELERALEIFPDNAEASLSLCAWHERGGRREEAARFCERAWRAAGAPGSSYQSAFREQCRSAWERVKRRP